MTYGKRVSSETYEDHRYKHLYEKHHMRRRNGLCKKFYQTKICEAGKYSRDSVNYKRDDIYQLENEEMSCDNVNVNYHDFCEFHSQRNAIDLKLKVVSIELHRQVNCMEVHSADFFDCCPSRVNGFLMKGEYQTNGG